jgi:hypothetical protein
MHAAGENRTERDPEINYRSPLSTRQSTENRTQAGDVEQLNEKQLPLRHYHIVNAIIDGYGRCLTIIR